MQYASNEYTRLTPTWQWFRQAIGLWISEREHATSLRSTPRQWLHTFWIETDSTPGFTSSNWKLEQDKLSVYVSLTYITRQRVLTYILTWKYTYRLCYKGKHRVLDPTCKTPPYNNVRIFLAYMYNMALTIVTSTKVFSHGDHCKETSSLVLYLSWLSGSSILKRWKRMRK